MNYRRFNTAARNTDASSVAGIYVFVNHSIKLRVKKFDAFLQLLFRAFISKFLVR